MNFKNLYTKLILPALTLAVLAASTSSAFAVTYDLAAVDGVWTAPDGVTTIPMWGIIPDPGACPGTPANWDPPATLTAPAGDTLVINLRNCLSVATSVFIPGQYKALAPVSADTDGSGRMRVTSFDAETAPNTIGTYTWNNIKEGTYLFHSGTHPQVQVQMGLYGALVVTGTGAGYPPLANDQVLLYSEIDPALHAAVADGTYGTPAYPSTFDYYPQYFLINGEAYRASTAPISIPVSQDTLLRFVNAGLKLHTPTLGGGLYMTLIAEDGNLYPFTVEQYSLELPPAKTIDAVVNIGSEGTYALYDRSLALTNGPETGGGMLVKLQAGAVTGAPIAADDTYAVAEDTPLNVAAPGVLGNDTPSSGLTASLVSDVSAGTLALNADGSFTYIPNLNFNGNDQFTYVANDGGVDSPNSNVATVSISVGPQNDPPSAVNDSYDVAENTTLDVTAPGVLGNDSDIDGDPLTAVISGASPGGLTAFNPDGSFSFDATSMVAGSSVTFDYVANDGTADSTPATVTINVVTAAANVAPVAVDDTVSTPRNTATPINVISNDYDSDGAIDPNSVALPNAITTRGGTVVVSGGGIVTYTPPNAGFRGTDTFTYTVDDNDGATSNVATVRVNVTK
jgi:FtsP/CotA-like multicopper oxidase with cupredoxin domain